MRSVMLVITATVLSLVAVATARPFRGHGAGGWGPGGTWDRLYDAKSVETLTGKVKAIEVRENKTMAEGIHIMLATSTETISIHLGPAWYIENQDVQLAVGDNVTVRGSRVTYDGKPAIIAADVTRGDDVLALRNDAGFPRWAAWRRRAR